MRVGIINYGLGNLKSLEMIIKNLDYDVEIIFSPKNLKNLDKAILPGVGSYSQAMKLINANFWNEHINEFALGKKNYLLGICLGMQILSSSGEEIKETKGLDIIKGKVVSLKSLGCNERIPHIGWNSIKNRVDTILLDGISQNTDFYFVHSYVFKPDDDSHIVSTTNYGVDFCSVIKKDNIFGTQFHPEKSSFSGRKILQNFLDS